jgi:serine/threonine protein kinase
VDDPRVIRAVQEYMAAMEAGSRPNRQAFLARNLEIAAALAECLDALDFVQAAAPRLDGSGAAASPAVSAPAIDPTLPLGDFRILREVGRGGMGVVYEAEQLSLGRRVALKVLPFAWTLDPRQLRRFQNEARAVAHLHHTNIVPIYSVGRERGVHFYAMQFIEGQSLAAVIQELRQMAGRPGPARSGAAATALPEALAGDTPGPTWAILTTERTGRGEFFRAVARLGAQAAEALEYAHEQGVVHRDVKPANLLVDSHGHLWISDFGLAQFQGDAGLTVSGDVVGTLRYMSPEQALAKRGLVDHRTDVYSLGATLYELLTLQPVFRGRDRQEILQQIAFEEPRPPRRHNPAVPADLETIVLKALAKRVEDRYATARELADDLRRYLEHRPVLARRPTLLERGAKWFRRHPGLVAAALGVLILAAVGLAVSTALVAREQVKTRHAYEAEARQRELAERSFRQARKVVDFFTRLSEEQLPDNPQLQGLRRRLLEEALDYYQEFIELRGDDPSLRAELVASQLRVATILDEIGSRDEALAALDRAGRLHPGPAADHPAGAELHKSPGSRLTGQEFRLLAHPAVQQALKLSEDQARRVTRLWDQRRQAFRMFETLSPDQWRPKLQELLGQELLVAELLQPEQARRLRQITVQHRGAEAFTEPEVADALQLTDRQRAAIRSILDETRQSLAALRQGGPRPEGWKKAEELWKSARERVLQELSGEQRARWQELIGEPFDLRMQYREGFGPRYGGSHDWKKP